MSLPALLDSPPPARRNRKQPVRHNLGIAEGTMTNREELPVWAKILLGIPVTEDSHSQCAVQPSDSSAPAPNGDPDHLQYLLRLDRVLQDHPLLRPIILLEAAQ